MADFNSDFSFDFNSSTGGRMAFTPLDMITRAMKHIGAIAISESPSSNEANDCFISLQNMIDSWNTQSLMLYSISANVFNLVAGQATYTLGSGGNFNTGLPVTITQAYVRDSQGNDYVLSVGDYQDYAEIVSKYTTSSIPSLLFDDGNYPLKNITFWPVPSDASFKAVLWFGRNVQNFSTLQDIVSMPQGYRDAVEYNLAVMISPMFGKPVSQDLAALATKTLAMVKRNNYNIDTLDTDPVLSDQGLAFNYYNGSV